MRTFDGAAWLLAERAATAIRDRARPVRLALQRTPTGPAATLHPLALRLAAAMARGDDLAVLRAAQALGAFDIALPIADQLAATDVAPSAWPAIVGVWLACRGRAAIPPLAPTALAALARSDEGIGLLRILAQAPPPSRTWRLPSGGIDADGLAMAIAAGDVDAATVERLLRDSPAALLRDPALHLLASNAARHTAPGQAAQALAHALRAYGMPTGTFTAVDGVPVAFAGVDAARPGALVSIIVAAYNAAPTIERAIVSLLAQSHRNLEILVGDDASTDDTLARVRARFATDPRVRLFASGANQGAYQLRNALAREARGALLTFHDADDLATPTRIAEQVAAMRSGVVASYACMLRLAADGRVVFFRDHRALRLAMVSLMTTPATFAALGGFRGARFGADFEFHETLRHRHGDAAIAIARRPLLLTLWGGSSVTRQAGAEALEDGYRAPARRRYMELLAARWLDGDAPGWPARIDAALAADDNLRTAAPIEPA